MPEPVPTVPELAHRGLADYRPGGKGQMSYYRVSDEGHALLGEIQRRNAAEAIADGAGDWYPEPPHRRPKGTS
ncbi:hypothetical protein PBI_SMARTIES_78 [Microbacterium phage Smarties]|uniref:Uncharacterized protein n=1 Tax=Microbacterium phage Ariadne TaxID=2656546 RepID=A0A649VAU4_9CAUD|nr:hypothetical protein QDA10_gp078 [Microbacterium phage Ariadne]QGJ89481.1 hypothetical protein PBI_ARIADNE_78 [Microbacterium phage Ariadne]QGJ91468.1 hypothetical protein PBI_SMARTIES_78 [Microbacterium phage Smarties]